MLNLVSLLLKSRRPVSKGEILEQVEGYQDAPSKEARERTFERDKRRLAELGLELAHNSDSFGHEGYRLKTEEALLPPISLAAEERLILETLVRGKLTRADDEFARQARGALFKLMFDNFEGGEEMTHGGEAAVAPELSVTEPDATVVGTATQEVRGERAKLEVLLDAVTSRRTVTFDYAPPGQDAQARTVDPWGLAFVRGAWYVAGFARERGDERIFKVMRIIGKPKRKHPQGRGGDFERPADYDVADTVRRLLKPRDPEGQLDKVELRVAADVAFMMRDWTETEPATGYATFKAEPDGSGLLTLYSPLERTVWHIYANYAPKIEVRSPQSLRDAFTQRLRTLKRQHRLASGGTSP